jgi:hypothetical protein
VGFAFVKTHLLHHATVLRPTLNLWEVRSVFLPQRAYEGTQAQERYKNVAPGDAQASVLWLAAKVGQRIEAVGDFSVRVNLTTPPKCISYLALPGREC